MMDDGDYVESTISVLSIRRFEAMHNDGIGKVITRAIHKSH